jgi:hypothetical protein
MGQYYKPINTDKIQFLYSHDYKYEFEGRDGNMVQCGNGLKLMEHSYIGNNFVGAVERLLLPDGAWYKDHIVWCGDYADFFSDSDGNEIGFNWYTFVGENEDQTKITPFNDKDNIIDEKFKFILNHDKKQFVDRSKKLTTQWDDDTFINPLPILLADGNGRGGGDYHGDDMDNVGVWAYDPISIEDNVPKGFTELVLAFKENR